MTDKYLDRLVKPDCHRGGYCVLNENVKGMVVEGVVEVSFNSLYPRLLLYLHENGILDKFDIDIPISSNEDDVIGKLRYYFENNLQRENKLWINSIWNRELRTITFQVFELFHQYMSMFYEDVIANIPYNWLYIDTDVLYLVGDESMFNDLMQKLWFPIGYTTEKVPFMFIESKKRYVKSDMIAKGFSRHNIKRRDEIVSIMKIHIRNRKLDDILC